MTTNRQRIRNAYEILVLENSLVPDKDHTRLIDACRIYFTGVGTGMKIASIMDLLEALYGDATTRIQQPEIIAINDALLRDNTPGDLLFNAEGLAADILDNYLKGGADSILDHEDVLRSLNTVMYGGH